MKQAVYSSRTADKFVVRLPDGMRERIAEVARNHHRSMNSEIIARLEQSLLQEGALDDDSAMRLDSPELMLHERELLQRFRQLAHRQQNALIALIAQDPCARAARSDAHPPGSCAGARAVMGCTPSKGSGAAQHFTAPPIWSA